MPDVAGDVATLSEAGDPPTLPHSGNQTTSGSMPSETNRSTTRRRAYPVRKERGRRWDSATQGLMSGLRQKGQATRRTVP